MKIKSFFFLFLFLSSCATVAPKKVEIQPTVAQMGVGSFSLVTRTATTTQSFSTNGNKSAFISIK